MKGHEVFIGFYQPLTVVGKLLSKARRWKLDDEMDRQRRGEREREREIDKEREREVEKGRKWSERKEKGAKRKH